MLNTIMGCCVFLCFFGGWRDYLFFCFLVEEAQMKWSVEAFLKNYPRSWGGHPGLQLTAFSKHLHCARPHPKERTWSEAWQVSPEHQPLSPSVASPVQALH